MGCNSSSDAAPEEDIRLDEDLDADESGRENHKVVLVGDKAVGKSSIVMRYTKNHFSEGHTPTIGAAFVSKDINVHNSDDDSVSKSNAPWFIFLSYISFSSSCCCVLPTLSIESCFALTHPTK